MIFLSSNLKFLRKKKGIGQVELAEIIGVKPNTISNYENSISNPDYEILQKIIKILEVDADSFLYLNLETNVNKKDNNYAHGDNLNIRTLVIATDVRGDEILKFVPTTVFAGYLKGFSDPEYIESLPSISISGWLPDGSYRGFEVKGDSMEPTYRPGDKILARYVENWYKIREMDTYVIVTREDIVIKRIQKIDQKEGYILCMSDNNIYPSYKVYLDEILEVWRVEAFIRIGQSIPKTNIDELRQEIEELKKQINKDKK